MTRARRELVHPETTPYYHCIARCVRRAFLHRVKRTPIIPEKRYDTNTNVLRSVTDPVGRTTFFTYDSRGNRTSVRNVEDHTTLIDYHPRFNKPVIPPFLTVGRSRA